MNKVKFVLLGAVAFSVVLVLSCSDAKDAVEEAKCTAAQGDWDAATKKCVKCPDGTTMDAAKQCVADKPILDKNDGGVVCPPPTKPDSTGTKCVAEIIATDPETAAGTYYCDYGDKCLKIKYESECDSIWGKIVPSCKENDRRKDTLTYCDYGPIAQGGLGCYPILDGKDCDTKYGVIRDKCEDGKGGGNNGDSLSAPPSYKYCYNEKSNDCYIVSSSYEEEKCKEYNGKIVSTKEECSAAVIKEPDPSYCYNEKNKECYLIGSSYEEVKCKENNGNIVPTKEDCKSVVVTPSDSTSKDYLYCCQKTGNIYQIGTSSEEAQKCKEYSGTVIKDKQECVVNNPVDSISYYCCEKSGNNYQISSASGDEAKKCKENSGTVVKDKQECVLNNPEPTPTPNPTLYYCCEKSGNIYQIGSSSEETKKCTENSGTVIKDKQECKVAK